MIRETAKEMAKVMKAYADGKDIQVRAKGTDEWVDSWPKGEVLFDFSKYEYRIKPEKKKRRMTQQELADWLRDEPMEHREYAYNAQDRDICSHYIFEENCANEPCEENILVRRNPGEWEQPIVEE